MRVLRVFFVLLIFGGSSVIDAQEREIKVRGDKKRVESDGYWIYNDLPLGIEQAKETKKPQQ